MYDFREYMNIVFFGSTKDSVIVLEKIASSRLSSLTGHISAVVTQPARPVGRKQIMTSTPVELWAKQNNISILTFPSNRSKPWCFANEKDVINSIETFTPDLLISASFGEMIPWECIRHTKYGGINIHPSLLPRWRGADPIPWTILSGDAQTGVTVVSLSQKFDEGKIFAQKKISVFDAVHPDLLRKELFTEGAQLLIESLPDILSGKNKGVAQKPENAIYARKLKRDDGFVPWNYITCAMNGEDNLSHPQGPALKSELLRLALSTTQDNLTSTILLMARSLSPWPGVWTTINVINPTDKTGEKRMKILACHGLQVTGHDHPQLILDEVQIEGKNPVKWNDIKNIIVNS